GPPDLRRSVRPGGAGRSPRSAGGAPTGHLLVRGRRHGSGRAARAAGTAGAARPFQGRTAPGRHQEAAGTRPGRDGHPLDPAGRPLAGDGRHRVRRPRGRHLRGHRRLCHAPDRAVTGGAGMSAATGPVGVGIIGAGVIASQYLDQLTAYPDVDVRAIGDLRPDAAAARAAEYGVPAHGPVETVLDHPDVEIVVNLTIPAAHVDVSRDILTSGKHVWSEKPLTTGRQDARTLLDLAAERGLRIGGAPDTVLGAGIQSALRSLAAGQIGEPRSALAQFRSPGPEAW